MGCTPTQKSVSIDFTSRLGEVELEKILSFLLPVLEVTLTLARTNRRVAEIITRPGCWEDAHIDVPRFIVENDTSLLKCSVVTNGWRRVAVVQLPPYKKSLDISTGLHLLWPQLKVKINCEGPYPLFCMPCEDAMRVGSANALHFFEPRYRFMIQKLLNVEEPKMFCWITGQDSSGNSVGSLCQVRQLRAHPSGAYDCFFTCRAHVRVINAWSEAVPDLPRAPKLGIGLVCRLEDSATSGENQLPGIVFEEDAEEEGLVTSSDESNAED